MFDRAEPGLHEQLHEYCGIVAVYSPTPRNQLEIVKPAGDALQHRGLIGVGIMQKSDEGDTKVVEDGLLRDAYPEMQDRIQEESTQTLLHLRYGTSGNWSSENLQPLRVLSKFGYIYVVHNGEFPARDQMLELLDYDPPEGISDTALFAHLLSETEAETIEEAIMQVLSVVRGAYSLAISNGDSMYLIRDPHGIKPLFLGQIDDGWIAVSETFALDVLGVPIEREVRRGEFIRIDQDGLTVLNEGLEGPGSFCAFELAYFQRPESKMPIYHQYEEGTEIDYFSVGRFTRKCGQLMGREYPIPDASYVVGVPSSGMGIASGYAQVQGLPLKPVIIRDHYNTNGSQRTFMRDDNPGVQSAVIGKLSFDSDPETWKDRIVVVGDDSIVRSNVSRAITAKIFSLGAREVHWMVGFPPVMHTCHLGTSMRTEAELIAAVFGGDPVQIAEDIGATSVNYITPEMFNEARLAMGDLDVSPHDAKGLCMGCVTGVYPVDKFGNYTYEP